MKHVDLPARCQSLTTEVEVGFTAEQTRAEVERCLNCDVQTDFIDTLCIECDACIDICPMDCLTIAENGEEPAAAHQADGAGGEPQSAAVRVRSASSRPAG